MNSRQRFQKALQCQAVDRPPVWIMRQAGRYLPEYRKLKEKYSFLEMVKTPDLAVEVSLQPLRRFSLDAAIVFSDILVIPEAMGQPYHFKDEGGIAMDFALNSRQDIEALDPNRIRENLDYVAAAERQLRDRLSNGKAVLGFAGSPWTLAAYMIEGSGSKEWEKARRLFQEDPQSYNLLMEKLVAALSAYCSMQAEAGVDAIQIFDSWAAACPPKDYWEMSLRWIQEVIDRIQPKIPIILYAKGAGDRLPDLSCSGASVLSLDWTVNLREAADRYPGKLGFQGNLDPELLNRDPEPVRRATRELLQSMGSRPGFIVNLGHGIQPTARIENVEALVETVCSYSNGDPKP